MISGKSYEGTMRIKILVSSCLLGNRVRYDGTGGELDQRLMDYLEKECELHPFCPECEGGLDTPRTPAEICGGNGDDVFGGIARVKTNSQEDVTDAFVMGAERCVDFCSQENITISILKERSPSCGSSMIYNGTFSGSLIQGMGVTTSLLRTNNIMVYSDEDIDELILYLHQKKLSPNIS